MEQIYLGINSPKSILPYVKKHTRRLFDKNAPPSVIQIAVNNVCNAKCKMCDYGQRNINSTGFKVMTSRVSDQNDLTPELFKKFLDDVKSFKPDISFKLIEPLLNPNLPLFIKMCNDYGLKVQVTTNAFLLPTYAKQLIDAGLDHIHISIDGPPELHNEIRGLPDGFNRSMKGIKLLTKYAKQKGQKIRIFINCTILNLNYTKLAETLDHLKNVKEIEKIKFQHLNYVTQEMANDYNERYGKGLGDMTTSTISDEVDPKKMNIDILYNELVKINKKTKSMPFFIDMIPRNIVNKKALKTFYFHPEKFIKGHDKCRNLIEGSYLASDGSIRIHTRCYDISFGNINDNTFLEIWNGPKYKNVRKKFNKNTPIACSRCCGVMFY